MAGWLTNYWEQLIKFPPILRREMRHNAKVIEHTLPHMKLYIYQKIPQEVMEHQVSKGIVDEKRVVKDSEKVEKQGFKLGFRGQILEAKTIDTAEEIEKRIILHEEQHKESTGLEADFGKKILQIFEIENESERKIYFTYLEPILKIAEEEGDHDTLIAAIRRLGPAQINTFAAIAIRLDIRMAGTSVSKLKADKKHIEEALYTFDRVSKNKELARKHLKVALDETTKHLEAGLHGDALVGKRNFLLALLSLKYIDDEEGMERKYVKDTQMPRFPEEVITQDLEKVKQAYVRAMQVLAQGMRRIFAQEQQAEKLAQTMIALAKRK